MQALTHSGKDGMGKRKARRGIVITGGHLEKAFAMLGRRVPRS